jgi:FkbM family methyltransferase
MRALRKKAGGVTGGSPAPTWPMPGMSRRIRSLAGILFSHGLPLRGYGNVRMIASAIAFAKLQENLALNPGHAVRAVNVALASRHDLVSLETPVVGNLGTTRVADRANVQPDRGAYVAALPLGEVLERLSAKPIGLMKIDVEGYEIEVFRGMDFAGPHRPEHIIMEYSERLNSDSHDLAGCYHLLESHGYVPYTVTGQPFTRSISTPIPEENLWWRRA